MQNIFTNKKCQSHKLNGLTLSHEQLKSLDDMIPCSKCLIETKSNLNRVVEIEPISEMVQKMKQKQWKEKQEQINSNYSYFQKFAISIENYKVWIEGLLIKMFVQIYDQLDQLKTEIDENNNIQKLSEYNQQDVSNPCLHLNDQNGSNFLQQTKEQEIVRQIFEQVTSFHYSQQYQQLLNTLQTKYQKIKKVQPPEKSLTQLQQKNVEP